MERRSSDVNKSNNSTLRRGLPLSLPAYPSSDSLSSVTLEGAALALEPPAPAPSSPARNTPVNNTSPCTLAKQSRNGSDASFKVCRINLDHLSYFNY